jgi:hypothetical protein
VETSQETLVGIRTYRFSLGSQVNYLVLGAFFVALGLILLTRDFDSSASDRYLYWAAGIGLFLAAAYFATSAAYSVVFFDQGSVTVRGVFSTQSIRRRSVSSYLVVPGSKNQAAAIRLISDSPEEMNLDVPRLYAFDDAWKQWISSLSNLTEQEEARFTPK